MIEIRAHVGLRRGNVVDTGLDGIWLVEPHRIAIRIGFASREQGAPLQLTENGLSPAVIAEARRALAMRDGDEPNDQRLVTEPPRPIEDDHDDDCDE